MTSSPSALPDAAADPAAAETVSVATLYRRMWRYAEGARGMLLLSSAMLVGSQLVKLLVPWLTAQAINTLQRGGPASAADCLPWIGGIVGVYLVCWALHGPGRVIERTVSLRVRRALTDTLYARLSEAPLAWHATQHPAELAHRLTQATQALTNFTQSQFIYLQNAVNLAGPLLALWFLSNLVGAAALVGICDRDGDHRLVRPRDDAAGAGREPGGAGVHRLAAGQPVEHHHGAGPAPAADDAPAPGAAAGSGGRAGPAEHPAERVEVVRRGPARRLHQLGAGGAVRLADATATARCCSAACSWSSSTRSRPAA